MSKVTSKLQVTIPRALARQYGIEPGDKIEFQAAGPQIRVLLGDAAHRQQLSKAERLRLFDQARLRQREREEERAVKAESLAQRGWTREELYSRGESD